MDFEDLMEPEVGVAVGVTAVIASPSVRKTLRKGAVYGLAGIMLAGDAAMNLAKALGQGVKRGVRDADAIVEHPESASGADNA